MHVKRLLLALAIYSATLTPALAQTPAAAQPAAASPLCTGTLNIVRVSDIKPGMMGKFLQAVAAQQAWYKAAGTSDVIQVMRIMDRNPDTHVSTFSETQALTTHIEPAIRAKGPAHDAGYDAFVAMFKDSSSIKSEYVTCIVQ
jgi:hypothetical protein